MLLKKKVRALHVLEDLEPLFLNFRYICLQESSGRNYRQIYGKPKAILWRNLRTGTPPKCFSAILCLVALVYIDIFFTTAVLRKLFDMRFVYKHCNFSHALLLVKMASKTVTRSIRSTIELFSGEERRLCVILVTL